VGKVWYNTIPELIDEIQALECASQNKEQRELPADVIDLVAKAKALVQERDKLESEREIKRRGLHYSGDFTTISSATVAEQTISGPEPPQLAPGHNIWWDSTEAQSFSMPGKRLQLTA
jgi:hypothetical protein